LADLVGFGFVGFFPTTFYGVILSGAFPRNPIIFDQQSVSSVQGLFDFRALDLIFLWLFSFTQFRPLFSSLVAK
jgi:hypothetical protein